jgi:hypothetical protein
MKSGRIFHSMCSTCGGVFLVQLRGVEVIKHGSSLRCLFIYLAFPDETEAGWGASDSSSREFIPGLRPGDPRGSVAFVLAPEGET